MSNVQGDLSNKTGVGVGGHLMGGLSQLASIPGAAYSRVITAGEEGLQEDKSQEPNLGGYVPPSVTILGKQKMSKSQRSEW